jgi:hypothetical protein
MTAAIRLMIATHTHGTVMPAYALSLANAAAYLARIGLQCEIMMFEDSLVCRARDRAAAEMLAGNYTHLLFIDADEDFEPEAIIHLLKAGKPLIGGAVRRKNHRDEFALTFFDAPVEQCPESKAVKVARIGTGFLLIERQVFERIAEAFPEIAYVEHAGDDPRQMHAFFEHVVRDGIRWSEDYSFCERWKSTGGDVWLCPFVEFGHWGKAVWRGSVLGVFRRA